MKNYLTIALALFFCLAITNCKDDAESNKKLAQHIVDSLNKKKYVDSLVAENLKLRDSMALPQHTSLADKYNQLRQSVLMVYVECTSGSSQGSAFVLNNKLGICISNNHVFKDFVSGYAIDFDGHRHEITKLLLANNQVDYEIFTVENINQLPNVNIAPTNLQIGDDCFAIGNPKGLQQTLSTGIVSGYRENDNVIQTTTSFTHGSSGGPLFNSNGEVIGITTSIFEEVGNLNFALNIRNLPIQKYISSTNLPTTKNNTTPTTPAPKATAPFMVPTVIIDFIKAEEARDFNKITSYFAPNMQQYWEIQNPTIEQLKKGYISRWQKMSDAKNEIVDSKQINANTYQLTINFSYFSIKDNITKTVNGTKVVYVLDADEKIVKVYGVK